MQIFGLPGWSAVYAGGLKTIELPPDVRRIIIAADNDVSGAGQRNALAAYDRWTAEGRSVRIKAPPVVGDDFNDVLSRGAPMPGTDEFDADPEAWRKQFWSDDASAKARQAKPKGPMAPTHGWDEPDMGVLRLRRRPPPALPLEVFGEAWKQWLIDAAAAAACPVDYVVAPLLASVSTLIGNARWAQAWPGWGEPPHLWAVAVGDSGTGKSPGADCLMRDVLPTIERRMVGDYPDRLREWQAAVEFDKIAKKRWKDESPRSAGKEEAAAADAQAHGVGHRAGKAAPASARRDHRAGWRDPRHRRAEGRDDGARRDRRLVDGDGGLQPRRPRFLARSLWRAPLPGRAAQATARSRSRSSAWSSPSMAARSRNGCPSCRPAPTTGCFRASYGCGPTPSRFGAGRRRPNVDMGDRGARSPARARPGAG